MLDMLLANRRMRWTALALGLTALAYALHTVARLGGDAALVRPLAIVAGVALLLGLTVVDIRLGHAKDSFGSLLLCFAMAMNFLAVVTMVAGAPWHDVAVQSSFGGIVLGILYWYLAGQHARASQASSPNN